MALVRREVQGCAAVLHETDDLVSAGTVQKVAQSAPGKGRFLFPAPCFSFSARRRPLDTITAERHYGH